MKTRITLIALLAVIFSVISKAQDTTIVQTLQFSDITKRRGWYVLPPDTGSFRQVLMYYTLKCDPATTQDNYNCGEWDYTTYTNIYKHKNIGDRLYTVNGNYPDTVFYNTQPAWNYFQSHNYFIVYDNVISENDYPLASGIGQLNNVLSTDQPSGKSQYIFTASELTGAGVTAGNIDKLRLAVMSIGSDLNNFTVKMKNSALGELTQNAYEVSGLTEVFHGNVIVPSTGSYTINLTTPFIWDGISNIVVEFSFTNNAAGSIYEIDGGNTGFNSGVTSSQTEKYMEFEKPDYIDVPSTAFATIDSFITISFWQYGDPTIQPSDSYIFEGTDSNDRRVINSHLPWGNSEVYWDAGNSGSNSYDRINKAANFSDFAGKWNHWAFVKDVSIGSMKIYLNGVLWHSGTGKTRTMEGIKQFKIGGQANMLGAYDGYIDEFRVWNVAVSDVEIADWMNKKVDPSHPNYSNLQFAYDFNGNSNIAFDYSPNNYNGTLIGVPTRKILPGSEIAINMLTTSDRPNITFVQGNYVTHLDSVLVFDSTATEQISITVDSTARNLGGSGIGLTALDTVYGYAANVMTYTYNPSGNIIDSALATYGDFVVNNYKIVTHQLQNYVTPYGIGIDLGPNGFRWVYDVTDYLPILHDTLELLAGNQQELIDVKFVYISGTPPRDIIDFETIWLGDYNHAAIANDIALPAVDVDLNPLATHYTVRTRTTGHWFGGFQNCAEFCPKYHNLSINGSQEFEWLNWKECSSNPIVDQGGTWIYDRAGWCPGTFAETFDHNITPFVTPGSTASIDYGMEYTPGGMEGNYRTTVQLISYGDYNFNLDASIVDVIAPNKWEYHNRFNPICGRPVIVVRNTGVDTLLSLDITYRVEGGADVTYNWTGSLAFGEDEKIELYAVGDWFWSSGTGSQVFEVEISNPNGGTDEYVDNNYYKSEFELPPTLPQHWYLWYQTNTAGYENSYYIYNMDGDTLYQRVGWANSTLYRDTFDLDPGCYTLEILDSDEDGVSFFANSDGNGWIRWRPVSGGSIYTFEPNFGDRIIYNFMVGGVLEVEEEEKPFLQIYPNPSNGLYNVETEGFIGDVSLDVYASDGQRLQSSRFTNVVGSVNSVLDLTQFSNGMYLVKMSDGTRSTFMRVVKQ